MEPTAELASVDQIRLSAWIEAAPISRATAYQLLQVLGITPTKARVPGSRADVAMLSAAQARVMDDAAARMKNNGARLADFAAAAGGAISRHTEVSADDQQTTEPPPGPELLLARLEAIERACRTGAPLSTAEVSWLLGARPGEPVVTRGRVTAIRQRRNVWSLSTDTVDDP